MIGKELWRHLVVEKRLETKDGVRQNEIYRLFMFMTFNDRSYLFPLASKEGMGSSDLFHVISRFIAKAAEQDIGSDKKGGIK
jgi:hypothetical protein